MTRVDQQEQRLKELADIQDQQDKKTGDRLDRMVLFNLTSKVNDQLDKYEETREQHVQMRATLRLAVTVEDKVAITGTLTRLQTRVTRLRTEITALAQEAGMDVTSRLEDFQF